jgi:predicted HNH restriction endonuclease
VALKATNYCCAFCGVKQSAAKGREVRIEVHHLDPVQWDGLFDDIRRRLLHDPSRLAPACEKCHKKITEGK